MSEAHYPKWFQGELVVLEVTKIMSLLDKQSSQRDGYWFHKFLRFLRTHSIEPVNHSAQADIEAFCNLYGHCWECIHRKLGVLGSADTSD